jgi:hypothetical protein
MGTPLNGYIKLYRKMLEWGWYDDTNTKVVFLHLLLTANYKDTEWHGIPLKRGDVVTSIHQLATDLKLSDQNVRTALSHLKLTGEITSKPHTKFSIISIKNYNQYQEDNTQANEQLTNNQRTTNNSVRSKEVVRTKESKNVVVSENYDKIFEIFNQICISLDSVENPTAMNIRRVSELLQQQPTFDFYNFFNRVERSDFLTGRNGRWNVRGCKASFDWLLQPKNISKIQSGQFDNADTPNVDYKPNYDEEF